MGYFRFFRIGLFGILILHLSGCAGNQRKLSNVQSDINNLDRSMVSHQERYQDLNTSRQRILNQMKSLFETEIPSIAERQQLLQPKQSDLTPKTIPASPLNNTQEQSVQERTDALDLFHKANAGYNQGKYREAAEEYMMAYDYATTDDLKARCLYRIGDCRYSLQQWDEAIRTFTKLETDYPSHTIIPSAMLKKGYSQIFKGSMVQGKQTLQILVSRYPDSDEAALAKARLKELGK